MTVPYEGSFLRAIFRWNGSVWKSIWKELLVWIAIYYAIRVIVWQVAGTLDHDIKEIVKQFYEYTKNIPVEFLLGFYVTQTVTRWWSQVMLISSPHDVIGTVLAYIYQPDEESQRLRYVIARYLVLYSALAYRNISSKIRKLFPTNERFVEIGLMTQEEKEIVDRAPKGIAHELIYQWIAEIVREKSGNHNVILTSLNTHRSNLKQLGKYNDFPLPLVYTQTVTIAVYGYFIFALIGHQFYNSEPFTIDLWFPFFTILRFFFGVGWLKVAEYLSKPFGNDDDDVDLCKSLSSYCDNVFTIATFVNQKPLNSWKSNDVNYERIQNAFKEHIVKYDNMGKILADKFKKVLIRREDRGDAIKF